MSAIEETAYKFERPARGAMARALLGRGVLVLNQHWAAVNVCTVRRALSLLLDDDARVVTEDYQSYDFDSWRDLSRFHDNGGLRIRTPRFALLAPEVIVLSRYNRIPPRRVKFNRRNIFLRDGFTCQYCRRRPPRDQLTLDHVVPRSQGGKSNWLNVVVACARCNTKKGDRLPELAGMKLRKKPRQPHWLSTTSAFPGPKGRTIWQKFVDDAYWTASLQE